MSDTTTDTLDLDTLGREMYRLVEELYPICRSITGEGLRQTLRRVQKIIPLTLHEVPTGTQAFDWTVPKEWTIRDAYVKDAAGERIIDFRRCNLHVVNYSAPVKRRMPLAELKAHLFTLPDHPDWIPYRTSYYEETWGFCLPHRQLLSLPDGEYDVCIDSSLQSGYLTYGDCYLPGESRDEVLVSCHVCHPSLCNDNLSGLSVATFLAQRLAALSRRLSYRFLFIPGTIGSIVWLSRNESNLSRIKHGVVLTCLADSGGYTYKKSRQGAAEIDRAFAHVLRHSGEAHQIVEFSPYGYDERQYCSPGFDLPVGCFMRTPHGRFAEYHTSADDPSFIRPDHLARSLQTCASAIRILENNRLYVNRNPKCEPQLGRRGLYPSIGGHRDPDTFRLAILWVLNLSDGRHALLDIAERARMPFELILDAARLLHTNGLLAPHRAPRSAPAGSV